MESWGIEKKLALYQDDGVEKSIVNTETWSIKKKLAVCKVRQV